MRRVRELRRLRLDGRKTARCRSMRGLEDGNVPASTIRQGFRLLEPTGEVRQHATLLDDVWNDQHVEASRE